MCGIAGTLGVSSELFVRGALAALAHRGPDGEGLSFDGSALFAMAHRRLSIVDQSDGGSQPMSSSDGRFVMVFNGEIYNYRDLAGELLSEGVDVRGQGDSRVLLEGYRVWGRKLVAKLQGMFAFVIIDRQGGDDRYPFALAARDRLGIKPLYFGNVAGGVAFSSEVRPFIKIVGTALGERSALRTYVRYGSLLDGSVVLGGVREQHPATVAEFGQDGTVIDRWTYWELGETAARTAVPANLAAAAAAVREHLERVAHEQMAPDGPAGLMLSGGIDSSIIAALATRSGNRPPISVSIGARGTILQTDVEFARLVAGRLGIQLIERWIEDNEVDALVDDWLSCVDQPSGDGFNSFIASRVLASHCKVVLSGLGADELFGGYPHFSPERTPRLSWRQQAAKLWSNVTHLTRPANKDVKTPSNAPEEWVARSRTIADPKECLNPKLLEGGGAEFSRSVANHRQDFFQGVSRAELLGYLRGILLRDSDAMSMASSLELRPPFLDHLLVDYVFMLPQSLKLARGRTKPLLVDACADLLSPDIVARKKTGFSLPYVKWIQGPLRSRAMRTINTPVARSVFTPTYLAQLRSEVMGGVGATFRTWSHWVLLEWFVLNEVALEN